MALLPETVIIGPFHYRVVCEPKAWNEEGQGSETLGLTLSQRLHITIKPGLPPTQAADTLWHEVKHAIVDLSEHTDHNTYDQEEWITKTTSLELMVLRDNPDLVEYLMEPE